MDAKMAKSQPFAQVHWKGILILPWRTLILKPFHHWIPNQASTVLCGSSACHSPKAKVSTLTSLMILNPLWKQVSLIINYAKNVEYIIIYE